MNKPLAIEGVMECADPLVVTEAQRMAHMVRIYDEMKVAKEGLGYYRRASVDPSLSTARRNEHRKQVEELDRKCVALDNEMTAAVLS